MIERFELMLHVLLGNPMPPLPPLPGRRHALVDDFDAPDDLSGMSATDVAAAVGISRQGAHLRIQRAIQTGDWSGLLAPKFSNGLVDGVAPARSSIDDHVRTYR